MGLGNSRVTGRDAEKKNIPGRRKLYSPGRRKLYGPGRPKTIRPGTAEIREFVSLVFTKANPSALGKKTTYQIHFPQEIDSKRQMKNSNIFLRVASCACTKN